MHRALIAYVNRVWRQPASAAARLAMIILTRRACSSASSLARTLERRLSLLDMSGAAEGQLELPLHLFAENDDEPGAEIGAPGLEDRSTERRTVEAIRTFATRAAAAAESKMRCLERLLRRSSEPAIVFTEYRDTLHTLERLCARADIETVSLHGGLSPVERGRVRRRFNEVPCTLLATDAAAEGLNLHARCRLVVHYELPWSLARLEQRAGRVDRFGQTRLVHEIGLVAANTAEGLVLAPLAARASLARRTGTLNEGLATSFTEPRVATLVMSGRRGAWTPPPPTAISLPATAPAPASDAAIEEARRLTGLRSLERRSRAKLEQRISASIRHMADGAVHLEVCLNAPGQRSAGVERVRVRCHRGGLFRKRVLKDPDVGVGPELIIGNAALEAMQVIGLEEHERPFTISLAKREEEVYVPGESEPRRLSRHSYALRLLQYVRDEAHRFAQHYHHLLRHKSTFDETMR